MFVDILPTFAELTGAPLPLNLDGVSLAPTLRGEDQDLSKRFLYWEFPKQRLWQAGRLGKWKAVRHGLDGPLELYDLEVDPREESDVSGQYPEIVNDLDKTPENRAHAIPPLAWRRLNEK